MLVSLAWLRALCPVDASPEAVASALTARGLTVDSIGIAREVGAAFGKPLAPTASPPEVGGAKPDAVVRVEIDDPARCARYTAGIVRDVRAFSHGGADASERFDPHEVLDRALRVAAPQLRRSAQIEREYGEVPLIEGARRELEQVFLNLIVNAAQAIDGTGVVRVRTSVVDDTVEIAVADSGRGIAPEHLERIFDPFFTTKPVGEGTGLGLSISHEIVRRHGGRIDVASKLGQGTEFRVRLPIAG